MIIALLLAILVLLPAVQAAIGALLRFGLVVGGIYLLTR